MGKATPSSRIWLAFGLVALLAAVERLALWLVYRPVSYGDTPSYWRLADAILKGWDGYDGTRTPGYPFFLALTRTEENTWLAQMALGLGITLLVFCLGWLLSARVWFGVTTALVHTLNLGQLLFEANLLGETVTTFWLALALAGVVYGLVDPQKRTVWLAAGVGLAAAFALITRPMFIYYPFWLLIFVLFPLESGREKALGRAAVHGLALLAPVVWIAGSWVGFIHQRYGDWGLSTMTGYHLVQHTGSFFEYVPDQYASLRDTYLKYRQAHVAEYGTQTNAIWEAIPEMQEASGLNFYDLSRTLARLSVRLILEHPGYYLRNVLYGWWLFWRAPVYWSPESLQWAGLAPILQAIIAIQRPVLWAMNMIFIATSLVGLAWNRARKVWQIGPACVCLAGAVWAGSIVQTLLDHGDNPRFLVPMQTLVLLWVLWVGWQSVKKVVEWGSKGPGEKP